ncbi:MAG TPA: lanthionine synthetase LanC family protein [Gallionella sp.]|nr:lanthionine synthetase LanC family protein [Gallionella sp.]
MNDFLNIQSVATNRFLEYADEIGRHLSRTSVWDKEGKYCTWLGRRDIADKDLAPYSERNASLSPEFYSGTAGVALFLIELYEATLETHYRNVAVAAWKRSVTYMEVNEFPAPAISFYAGELGVLYVGFRMVEIEPQLKSELKKYLEWLCDRLEGGLNVKHPLDLIGGNAGAIAPLLYLAQKHGLNFCVPLAKKCADELVGLARWNGSICYWEAPKIHGVEIDNPPLTGFAHGASGIGMALLEAYRKFGDEGYLKHAIGAYNFEDALFNPDMGNWVDTRYKHSRKDGKIHGTFRGAWCHGAPGIAISHMRAFFLNERNRQFHRDRLDSAILTTQSLLKQKLVAPKKDASLCHGVFGLLDILLSYSSLYGDEQLLEDIHETANAYLSGFSDPAKLPSGLVAGGYSPALMVGLSGVGLSCLRMTNNKVPSALGIFQLAVQ